MKRISIYTVLLGLLIVCLQACGPSEEEKRARQQARLDSLRQIEQQRIEALMQARQDSINAAQAQQEMEAEEETATGTFAEDGQFAVQVGAWRSEDKADEMVSMLADRDYPEVYTVKIGDDATGDVWFRVRIGFFATEENAEQLGSELASELNTGYWVSKVR